MPDTRVRRTITEFGVSDTTDDTITSGQATVCDEVILAAAKEGRLTTRTDDDEGVITLDTGHGLSTGTFDIYSADSCRYGVTLTIVGDAATISGGTGAGDVLPADETDVTVSAPVSETFVVPASGARTIKVKAPSGKLRVSFRTSVPAIVYTVVHEGDDSITYFWDITTGGTSPLGANAIATIFMSNGDTAAQTPVITVGWND